MELKCHLEVLVAFYGRERNQPADRAKRLFDNQIKTSLVQNDCVVLIF